MLTVSITVFLLFYFLFDVHYYVRMFWTAIIATIRRKNRRKELFEEHIYRSICLTTDLDFQFHMNNARYLRDCDFARVAFWLENGIWDSLKTLRGALIIRSNHIRYRRSIHLFDTFLIKTKLLYWDDRSFYVENQIIRKMDNFVCAVNISEVAVTPSSLRPQQVVEKQFGDVTRPHPLAEIKNIIEANISSSDRMKKIS